MISKLLYPSLALLIGIGPVLGNQVEAAERLPKPEQTQPTTTRPEAAMENSSTGEIKSSEQGYRGNFGWFGANQQEIEAGDEPAAVNCQRPTDNMAVRLWDGNGACISDANRIRSPATLEGTRPEESFP